MREVARQPTSGWLPFATLLAPWDADALGRGQNLTGPTANHDGLAYEGLRPGPRLGVPDVENHVEVELCSDVW